MYLLLHHPYCMYVCAGPSTFGQDKDRCKNGDANIARPKQHFENAKLHWIGCKDNK